MGNIDRDSQGQGPARPRPQARPVAEPDRQKILRGIQRDIDAAERVFSKERPEQQVGGKQDWRTG